MTLEEKSEKTLLVDPQKPVNASLISPLVDFILLGGLTFLIFPLTYAFDRMPAEWFALAIFYISFVINFPHFMHSYQLLYPGFFEKIRTPEIGRARKIRLVISGLVVPLCLAVLLIYGILQPTAHIVEYTATATLFFVGWHYVKQAYGTLMVLAGRKGLKFSERQKKILLLNAYVLWIYTWAIFFWKNHAYSAFSSQLATRYFSILVTDINIPTGFVTFMACLSILTSLATLGVFLQKLIKNWRIFPITGAITYGAPLYLWMASYPVFINSYYFAIVPCLHSLQYLPFVWKIAYEKSKDECAKSGKKQKNDTLESYAWKKLIRFIAIGMAAGFLFFYLIPTNLDKLKLYDEHVFGPLLFGFCFVVFINIHHYFIDFAIWRRDNPDMKYLYR